MGARYVAGDSSCIIRCFLLSMADARGALYTRHRDCAQAHNLDTQETCLSSWQDL